MKSEIAAAPGHQLFDYPNIKYTPFAPGGQVEGRVAKGWDRVRTAFEENFAEGREKSAQLVISVNSEIVVDLWGSSPSAVDSTSQQNFDGDTITNLFSSGKQIETLVVALLVRDGLVRYEDKIVQYWPEFGQQGKEDVTIADLLRHEAGLPWFQDPCDASKFIICDLKTAQSPEQLDKVIEQSPFVRYNGSSRTYHGQSRGFVVDGILRRVDPQRRGIAQYVQEEIQRPLGRPNYFVTIPLEEQSHYNIAHIGPPDSLWSTYFEFAPALMGIDPHHVFLPLMKLYTPDSPLVRGQQGFSVIGNPQNAWKPNRIALAHTSSLNLASARAQQEIFDEFFFHRLDPEILDQVMGEETTQTDTYFDLETNFTQGGMCDWSKLAAAQTWNPQSERFASASKGLYGWGGWGGSLSLMDVQKRVTLNYVCSGMATTLVNAPRSLGILEAYQACMADGT